MHSLGAFANIALGGLIPTPASGGTLVLGDEAGILGVEQAAAKALSGRDFCRLHCAPDDADLSVEEQKLAASWLAARTDGVVNEVVVLAYADADYPSAASALPDAACELARRRGEAVGRHLEQLGAPYVHVISMARRANWLQKLLLTDEGQLKQAFESAGRGDETADDGFYQQVGTFLAIDGGPGRVIVAYNKELLYAH